MKNLIIVMLIAYICCPVACHAGNGSFDDIVSLINMKRQATPDEVTSKFGKPATIEEGHKKHIWHYVTGKGDLSIYWDSNDDKLEKISFETNIGTQTKIFTNSYAPYIKAGSSKLCDVLAALGAPKNMTIKPVTQELHYSFQNRILHMFFRKGTLVNYSFF